MTQYRDTATGDRIQEYWSWAAVALFLLITVDLLTTMYAAALVGVQYESNPVVRWALVQPTPVLVAMNLAATVLAGVVFYGLIETYRVTPTRARPYYGVVIEAWLGLLVASGLFVFANNLTVIVLGGSLL